MKVKILLKKGTVSWFYDVKDVNGCENFYIMTIPNKQKVVRVSLDQILSIEEYV